MRFATPTPFLRRILQRLCLVLLVILPSPPSWAEAPATSEPQPAGAANLKVECAQAYEQAQRHRQAGQLMKAKERAIFCAQSQCPALLRGDCGIWLREIGASLPSVIVDVQSSTGEPIEGARLFVDGEPIDLPGRARAVDPGPHHFEARAGTQRVESSRVITEGSKNQRITLRLPLSEADPLSSSPARSRRSAWPSYTLGGVAVVGLGTFSYFAIRGSEAKGDLEAECAPSCPRSRADAIKRDFLIADIALTTALASGAFSLYFALRGSESAQGDAAKVTVSAFPGGASATLSF